MSVQQKWIFGGLLGGLLLLLFPPFLYGPAGAGRQWGFLLGFPAYVVYHHALLRAVYAGRRCRGEARPGTMRAGRPAGYAGRTGKGRDRFSAAGNGQRRRFLIYRVLLHADCGVSTRWWKPQREDYATQKQCHYLARDNRRYENTPPPLLRNEALCFRKAMLTSGGYRHVFVNNNIDTLVVSSHTWPLSDIHNP